MTLSNIRYRDLAHLEFTERTRLQERLNQLDRSARSRAGAGVGGATDAVYYSVEEKAERDRIARTLAIITVTPKEWASPLYLAARDLFTERNLLIGHLGNPDGSVLDESPGVTLRMASGDRLNGPSAVGCALTIGLLISDAVEPPPIVIDDRPRRPEAPTAAEAAAALKARTQGQIDAAAVEADIIANQTPAEQEAAAVLAAKLEAETKFDNDRFALNADKDDPQWPLFARAFFKALGETESYKPLSARVLGILAQEGGGTSASGGIVDVVEFAKVMRQLAARGVTEHDPQLGRRISEALDKVQNVGVGDVTSEIGIDLPDLDTVSDAEVVSDNIRLMGPVICAAMLDELKAFQVVDKILESAQNGTLPIGKGAAGQMLYRRWKESPNRISEGERADLYAMTMGQPGGNPAIQGNTDFNDLWLRFVSSVSNFVRQQDVDKLLRAAIPSATGAQQMRKAARDLATNLSLHGYGMTYYAALELQGEVKSMIQLLSDPEIRGAYGARDMWQVIDQVATTDLGGARTSSRYRTLATCGAIITAWLANNIEKIMRPMGVLLDMMDVRSPMPRTAGSKATSNPTDYDLVNACELWLADTATTDSRVDEMSQPRMSPVMTSKPVQMPAFAREFMDEIPGMTGGFSGAMGVRNGASRH
ncbi:hypothetical protein VH567_00055 [Sphingomonas sp. 4RDLI-65]|uniref:hypothetical protein n=1 Tax=Sphingomonas sp. 4RDLI-65 TaxID=3111641 RepID=UPI003C15B63C